MSLHRRRGIARQARIIVGACAWGALLGGVVWLVDARAADGQFRERIVDVLGRYWTQPTDHRVLQLPPQTFVIVGDPVFVHRAGQFEQVGEVQALLAGKQPRPERWGAANAVQIHLFRPEPDLGASGEYFATPESLEWALDTLLTSERKQEIIDELTATWKTHQHEIMTAFEPVLDDVLSDAVDAIEAELPQAIERHMPELESIAKRWQQEIIKKEVLPLAREEVWPILRQKAEPVATEVGREIWGRVPLWRFGWRLAVDQTKLAPGRLTEKEFKRFVDQEVEPILTDHMDDFVQVVQETLQEAAQRPHVQEALRNILKTIARDPQFVAVARQIGQEAVLENERLHAAVLKHLESPRTKAALNVALARFEPALRRAADRVIGTKRDGVTPEFAAVLRNQIFNKDRRWFVIDLADANAPAPSGEITIRTSGSTLPNPFLP